MSVQMDALRELVELFNARRAIDVARFFTEDFRLEDPGASTTGDLNKCLVRRAATAAQRHRNAGHTLAPNDADFDAGLRRAVRNHGRKAALDEIDMLDPPIARFQPLANRKVDGFQVGDKQSKTGARQPRQNAVRRHVTSFGAASANCQRQSVYFMLTEISQAVDQSPDAQQAC
jgi:hypothetical protein